MEQTETYTIDIAKALRAKFGEKTPKWILRLAKKILHEDFLNTYFREGYTGVEFAEKSGAHSSTLSAEGWDEEIQKAEARLHRLQSGEDA